MKEFEVYAMFDRDAVEVLVDRVLVGVGLVKQPGCRTLCILDLTEGFEEVKVNAVAPGQSGSDDVSIKVSEVEKKRGGQKLVMFFK